MSCRPYYNQGKERSLGFKGYYGHGLHTAPLHIDVSGTDPSCLLEKMQIETLKQNKTKAMCIILGCIKDPALP